MRGRDRDDEERSSFWKTCGKHLGIAPLFRRKPHSFESQQLLHWIADYMKLDFERNRGLVVIGAVLALLAFGNDVGGALAWLYATAITQAGQAVLLVGVSILVLFLVVDRFVTRP